MRKEDLKEGMIAQFGYSMKLEGGMVHLRSYGQEERYEPQNGETLCADGRVVMYTDSGPDKGYDCLLCAFKDNAMCNSVVCSTGNYRYADGEYGEEGEDD
jgi:hypothetical protein